MIEHPRCPGAQRDSLQVLFAWSPTSSARIDVRHACPAGDNLAWSGTQPQPQTWPPHSPLVHLSKLPGYAISEVFLFLNYLNNKCSFWSQSLSIYLQLCRRHHSGCSYKVALSPRDTCRLTSSSVSGGGSAEEIRPSRLGSFGLITTLRGSPVPLLSLLARMAF